MTAVLGSWKKSDFLDEVRRVVTSEFPGADVGQIREENHRVTGSIVWSSFRGMEYRERNRLITEKVRNKLGLKGINIGLLFPVAPGEVI